MHHMAMDWLLFLCKTQPQATRSRLCWSPRHCWVSAIVPSHQNRQAHMMAACDSDELLHSLLRGPCGAGTGGARGAFSLGAVAGDDLHVRQGVQLVREHLICVQPLRPEGGVSMMDRSNSSAAEHHAAKRRSRGQAARSTWAVGSRLRSSAAQCWSGCKASSASWQT